MIINKKVTCSISINLPLSLTFNNGLSENGELLNWCYRLATYYVQCLVIYLHGVQGACVINTIATAQLSKSGFVQFYILSFIISCIFELTFYLQPYTGERRLGF